MLVKRLSLAILLIFSTIAMAEEKYAPPVALVELFTSQGCYSCPPAEKLMAESIVTRADVVALELHVDYWDDLVWGGSVWADPFSNPQFTKRQTGYNTKIRNTRSVYTPQIVIHGQWQAGGTQEDRIIQAVQNAASQEPSLHFKFSEREVAVEGALPPGARMVYAIYWHKRITDVTAGENKGKVLDNTNVVSELKQLPYGKRVLQLPEFDPKIQGCAVWIQQGRTGRVLSAAKCPNA